MYQLNGAKQGSEAFVTVNVCTLLSIFYYAVVLIVRIIGFASPSVWLSVSTVRASTRQFCRQTLHWLDVAGTCGQLVEACWTSRESSCRHMDIWKTFIQLRRPFRLERSS